MESPLGDRASYLKMRTGRHQHMTDQDNTGQDNLPAKTTTGNVVVATEQSGSLVARGLNAVRNRSGQALDLLSEGDLEVLFWDACGRRDYETALRIIHLLVNQQSALAEGLWGDLYDQAKPSDLFSGDEDEDEEWLRREEECLTLVNYLRKAGEQGDALAQDMLAHYYCGSWADDRNSEHNTEAV